MLEGIQSRGIEVVTFKCALLYDRLGVLVKLYEGANPGKDMLEFLGITGHNLVSKVFAGYRGIHSQLDAKTRYSDGKWPVYYCSAEEDTAIAEVSFHYMNKAGEMPPPLFYALIQATIKGGAKDLRGRVDEWPFMVDKDKSSYEKCWPLGRQAHEDPQICALIVPSARKAGGTNLPTFKEECIVKPKIVGSLELSFSGDKVAAKQLD